MRRRDKIQGVCVCVSHLVISDSVSFSIFSLSASWVNGGTLTEVGQNGTTPLELGVTTPISETKPEEVG